MLKKEVCMMLVACLAVLPTLVWAEESFTVAGEIEFEKSGNIYLQIVTEDQFKNDKEGTASIIINVGAEEQQTGKVSFSLENVPAGTYAITSFQDVDGDGDLTFGTFGPKEPWGTYQHNRPKFSGPKFEKMAFEVKENLSGISIKLK